MAKGRTEYSKLIPGTKANYRWPVRFDVTDGYIRIVQRKDTVLEVVLLSPRQYRELVRFMREHGGEG